MYSPQLTSSVKKKKKKKAVVNCKKKKTTIIIENIQLVVHDMYNQDSFFGDLKN